MPHLRSTGEEGGYTCQETKRLYSESTDSGVSIFENPISVLTPFPNEVHIDNSDAHDYIAQPITRDGTGVATDVQ